MAVWFTADTHFNHANIIKYSSRPFASLEDMTESLVENWNSRVGRGDVVYHLGDFALSWGKKHAPIIDGLLGRLSGQKWLIKGNHDRKEVLDNAKWNCVKEYHEIKVGDQRIVLCHYAMRVWNQSHRGAWMLYGHSHGSLTDIGGKTLDVGVDAHGFKPISFEEITEFMRNRDVHVVDHHGE